MSNEFEGDAIFYGNVGVGGLLGLHGAGSITESYSAGRITRNNLPLNTKAHGLVGGFQAGTPSETAGTSYWDSTTSGITNANAPTRRGNPKTTSELQTPTGYNGIYASWEQNLDGIAGDERPWDFGTSADYPILTWGHSARSIELQREPQPTATEYVPSYEEQIEQEEPEEYVAPPIVYNLNIRFNVKGLTLDEGESATYRVRMSRPPVGHPARVAITSNNPDVAVAPTEVTFSSANYNQWQTVKVSTLRDSNDTDESATLAHRGPNLSYGSILVTVNDIWPGTTTETVNGHTLTLHHTATAPAGVAITAPSTLDSDANVTVSAAPSHTPLSAPGYGFGQSDAARMLASIRVVNTPSDGLTICLEAPAALVTEAGDRPLALLRYAGGVWSPVAGAERREGAGNTGTTLLCADGVTEYGVFAAAYAMPDALGVAANLAAATSGAGTVVLTWTPAANATVHFVFGIKKADAEARNFDNLAAWGFTDRANAHTITDLESGVAYYFTVIGGRARPNGSDEWGAWTPLLTVTPD